MRLHNSNHHIFAAAVAPDGLGQHGMGLAHARSISKKELELAALVRWRTFLQPLLGSLGHRDHCLRKKFRGFKVSELARRPPSLAAGCDAVPLFVNARSTKDLRAALAWTAEGGCRYANLCHTIGS